MMERFSHAAIVTRSPHDAEVSHSRYLTLVVAEEVIPLNGIPPGRFSRRVRLGPDADSNKRLSCLFTSRI